VSRQVSWAPSPTNDDVPAIAARRPTAKGNRPAAIDVCCFGRSGASAFNSVRGQIECEDFKTRTMGDGRIFTGATADF